MVLYLIGLGLCDEKNITLRGLEYIKSSDYIYMEYYTSILSVDKSKLESLYEKPIILADREMIESNFDSEILSKAKEHKVSLLVVGDPFSATTHMDLYLRCVREGVHVETVHNASILNAVGITGLSLYRFGETVSIPFFTEKWRPYSFYEKICFNYIHNFHTLVLLDIKVKEISEENLIKGKKIYEKPKFMSVNEGLNELIEASEKCEKEEYRGVIGLESLCFGLARIGSETQVIKCGKIKDVLHMDFGMPLHSIVICGKTLFSIEKEVFQFYLNLSK
jgi:diphthine synthase